MIWSLWDIIIAEMDGFEVTVEIRKSNKTLFIYRFSADLPRKTNSKGPWEVGIDRLLYETNFVR